MLRALPGLIVLGILLALGFGASKPDDSVSLNPLYKTLKGRSCNQWRDSSQISHVKGDDEYAALACLGFLHGRDRAWQMDYLRRISQGRRSEVVGTDGVRTDFFMRLLDLTGRAYEIFKNMKAEDQNRFWAYSYGVNRGFEIGGGKEAYEFTQFGYFPDPWQPEDTVALILLQSFDQTRSGFSAQFDQNKRNQQYGDKALSLFLAEGLPWETTILKSGEYKAGKSSARATQSRGGNFSGLASQTETSESQGSNNWVLGPSRSKSGKAWLANDPHLEIDHPPFFYWAHVESSDFDVYGVTVPGIPSFPAGTNRKVSWGLTNSYLPAARVVQVPRTELKNAESFRPVIWVKMGFVSAPFFFKTFRRTAQGDPILPIDWTGEYEPVLKWTGFDLKAEDISSLFQMVRANSVQEMDRALAKFRIPSWNFVFSDVQGGIGFRAVGRTIKSLEPLEYGVPVRDLKSMSDNGDTALRVLSGDEMPHVLNPKRDFIVTANNRQWPEDASFHLGYGHARAFRAFRIEELLQKTAKHDQNSMKDIQCDVQAVDARFLLPQLLSAITSKKTEFSGIEKRAVSVLESWDFQATLDCKACPIYRRWIDRILEDGPRNENIVYRLLNGKTDAALSDTVFKSFQGALSDLKLADGSKDFEKWGNLHQAPFSHQSGEGLVTSPAVPTPGDDHSVNRGNSDWDGKTFEHVSGSSMRLIVEMTSPPTVYADLAGSNLDIDHPNLRDNKGPWMEWSRCELQRQEFPLDWDKLPRAKGTIGVIAL